MIRWLVTGAGGRLGRDTVEVLAADPTAWVVAANRAALDVTDPAAVHAAVRGFDIVINAAAWTDVDGAESAPAAACAVNATAVEHLAAACTASGARLLQVSTDYVFGATAPPGGHPEDAQPAPLNAYGLGKLAGERAAAALPTGYVVRTAWLYAEHGASMLSYLLGAAASGGTVPVADDRYGQPTWSREVATCLWRLGRAAAAGHAPPGVYHATATGRVSWYGFARALFARCGLDPDRVRPVASPRRPAARPADSAMAHGRWAAAGLAPPESWRSQLSHALDTSAAAAFRRGAHRGTRRQPCC